MHKSLGFLILVSLSIQLIGCNSGKENPNEILKREVIEIHDEVMPLMGDLKSLKTKVLEKSASLSHEDSSHEDQIQELEQMAAELDSAFDGMFVWMRQFKSDYEGMSSDEVKIYLLDQKLKVEKVNLDIKQAIFLANEALERE
ncbi:hypothetical protein [Aquiflexum lacus]|uniref:hypothetical protein n=1 Tax=Aquiflexum lacus TaxID=2483805 RepID=UPI001E61BE12|nr:hypothetical protein [Aquiflexum lacus]